MLGVSVKNAEERMFSFRVRIQLDNKTLKNQGLSGYLSKRFLNLW